MSVSLSSWVAWRMSERLVNKDVLSVSVSMSASVWVAGGLVYFSAFRLPVRIMDVWSVSVSVFVWV